MKTMIVLPCRLGSTRLKRKHLIPLYNQKIIAQMTFESCQRSLANRVVIATDSEEIKQKAEAFGAEVFLSQTIHESGSDRVAEVAKVYPEYDLVLNIQGDEPLVHEETIDALIQAFSQKETPKEVVMLTAFTHFRSLKSLQSLQNVKVVTDEKGLALYFSRSVIPMHRDVVLKGVPKDLSIYKKHLGLYAYQRDFLLDYAKMKPSNLERLESLEQLRILESGRKILMVPTLHDSIGIDTQEDMDALNEHLKSL